MPQVLRGLMTGSAADTELVRPHIYSKPVKKQLEKRFKDPNNPLRLVIVRDMWLGGFDTPCRSIKGEPAQRAEEAFSVLQERMDIIWGQLVLLSLVRPSSWTN